jgi:hypothetical protein
MWWRKWWKTRGANVTGVSSSPPKSSAIRESLPLLNRGLEIGSCDNAALGKVFSELDSAPETLLPDAMRILAHTGFLLFKSGRGEFAKRLLFTCLAWYLKNSKDQEEISSITKSLQYVFDKEGNPWSVEDIHNAAEAGRFGHAASSRTDIAGLKHPKRVINIADGKVTTGRTRFVGGITPTISSKLPLTTFHGWLKRLDPKVLNATGRLTLEQVFPTFGEPTPEQHLARSERLMALNVALSEEDRADLAMMRQFITEGIPFKMRRHRRYSGGDGLLPRGCYSSVCKDAAGNDGGSLSRELFAYIDPRVPGTVYIGDSTSARLNAAIGNSIVVMPGFCAVYVLLLAPQERAARAIFDEIYGPMLERTGGRGEMLSAIAFETRVDTCTIENVIDLRLPHTRQWFFDNFKNGDGHFLIKSGGTARDFYDLVPTLMHPTLGGNDVTNGIGSWMRSSGVNGLVFPSARSDASVTIEDGELVNWRGWNFVDYRTSRDLPATEVTNSAGGWPNFVQPGAQISVASDGRSAGSFDITGLQGRYDNLREQFEGPKSDADDFRPQTPPSVPAQEPPKGRAGPVGPTDIEPAS